MSHDLGPLPKAHPRSAMVRQAETTLMVLLVDWGKKYELTTAERTEILAREIARDMGYAIRAERRAPPELTLEDVV